MAASPTDAAIAVTRLGLGARPGEIDRVAADPRGWAVAQIRRDGAPQPTGDFTPSEQRMAEFLAYQTSQAQSRTDGATGDAAEPTAAATRQARQAERRDITEDTAQAFLARARLGAETERGFAERWALFWANALTVSAVRFSSGAFIDQYEREAIRPNVFGRFEDLAIAAEQHPAMLLYLDQVRSAGPDSRAGTRRKVGLNENLAREMLELHTVGADAGYTQADVTELARALTGWSTPGRQDPQGARQSARQIEVGRNGFVFRANIHEPGGRTVLGKTYPQAGKAQGEAILRDLARHPATAKRLSRRIAAHFVSDTPPERLVARLEAAWTESDGDLTQVARALVEAPETWTPQLAKIKTPYEFIISTHRTLNSRPERILPLRQALVTMGQPPFAAPSPEGWPDTAADWAGPDALGDRLSERTRLAVARAESRTEALTLLLMSPELQRR